MYFLPGICYLDVYLIVIKIAGSSFIAHLDNALLAHSKPCEVEDFRMDVDFQGKHNDSKPVQQ